jgi:hypothetical protein
MNGITENSLVTLVLLVGAAAVVLILRVRRGKLIGGGLILAAVLVWGLDSVVESPAEQLEARLHGLRSAFVSDDIELVHTFVAEECEELRVVAEQALDLVQIAPTMSIRSYEAQISADGQSADVNFRANGGVTPRSSDVTISGFGAQHVATRWSTHWIREADNWVLDRATRLDPLSGQEIGTLSAD